MDTTPHTMNTLFAQLGLPNGDNEIAQFVQEHHLANATRVTEADFWTASQAGFLQELLQEDADWAILVDELDSMLHH